MPGNRIENILSFGALEAPVSQRHAACVLLLARHRVCAKPRRTLRSG